MNAAILSVCMYVCTYVCHGPSPDIRFCDSWSLPIQLCWRTRRQQLCWARPTQCSEHSTSIVYILLLGTRWTRIDISLATKLVARLCLNNDLADNRGHGLRMLARQAPIFGKFPESIQDRTYCAIPQCKHSKAVLSHTHRHSISGAYNRVLLGYLWAIV